MKENFNSLVERVDTLRNLINAHQNQLVRDARYNKDGSISRAPHFSKRGHIAETDQVCTLVENYIANGGDLRGIYVASDRIGYNGPLIQVNDQYKDIVVRDLTNNITRAYQSKVCNTPIASIIAAVNPKYIDAGVTPLVPSDHWKGNSTIGGINVNGKIIASDPRTLNELNEMTTILENGGSLPWIGQSKMNILYSNALRQGAGDGAKAAFVHRGITETIGYLTRTNDKPLDALKVASSMIASTIDGAIREILTNDAAFSEGCPATARNIALTSYSLAKDCFNYVMGNRKSGSLAGHLLVSMENKGGGFISSILSRVGANFGAAFGSIGKIAGSYLGSGIGRVITGIIEEIPLGKEALTAVGTSITINGLLGGAGNEIMAIAKSAVSAVGEGVKIVASAVKGFVVAHPLLIAGAAILAILLLEPDNPLEQVGREKDQLIGEINGLFDKYKSMISFKTEEYLKSLASVFYDIKLKQEIASLCEQARTDANAVLGEKEGIEMIEKTLEQQKAIINSMSQGLPEGNVFSFVEDSIDWNGRAFYSSKHLLEMAQ